MKSILMLTVALLMGSTIAIAQSDSLKIVRQTLNALKTRPAILSEEQAMDLMTHPGKIDSIIMDSVAVMHAFSFLPFSHDWREVYTYQPVSFEDDRWQLKEKGYLYHKELMRSALTVLLIGLLMVYFLWQSLSRARSLRSTVKDYKESKNEYLIPNDLLIYRKNFDVPVFHREEVLWPIFLLLIYWVFLFCTAGTFDLGFYLSVAFWVLITTMVMFFFRTLVSQYTLEHLCKKYNIRLPNIEK